MAVETQGVVVDESRCIEDGALYLVEDRLETFKESHWPFDSGPCTALKVSFRIIPITLTNLEGSTSPTLKNRGSVCLTRKLKSC